MGKQVRFSKDVKKFIVDKMAQGFDVRQICEKWPDKVPHPDSIYRKAATDDAFGEEYEKAYTILLTHRMDEMHELSSKLASEVYPEADDWRQAEAALKRRLDDYKFLLGKMAPVFSRKFDKSAKVEVSGQLEGPQVNIINYHRELKDVSDICPQIDEKDDN